jgi:hypothetical protein
MNANWLSELAPEHPPPPPAWWPPARGWWIVAGVCLLLGVAAAAWRRYWRHADGRRARRAALFELQRIRANGDDRAAAHAIQRLLRRYALTVFGADRVAHLTGSAWIDFLAQHGGDGLAGDNGQGLLRAAFGSAAAPAQRKSWQDAAEAFIRRARGGMRDGAKAA